MRVGTTNKHPSECAGRCQVSIRGLRPAGKLLFGAAAATHSWPPDGCLAAVPADLAANHAPTMALPVSMVLVALAAKLFRIRRKHRLDGRSPSLQTQSVKAALVFLHSLSTQPPPPQQPPC